MKLELLRWPETAPPVERVLQQRLRDDGFNVFRWRDKAGTDYQPHAHDGDETLWVLDGEIVFTIGGCEYRLGPGDRLMLPKGTVHEAVAGRNVAAYLIGQRH